MSDKPEKKQAGKKASSTGAKTAAGKARKTAALRKAQAKAAAEPAAGVRDERGNAEPRMLAFRETPSAMPVFPVAGADERSGKYVYCIVQTTESLRFGPIGIGSEPAEVHTVNYKDIAAVVSDTPLEVYDPTRENVLAHERVNEVVMRDFTVLPMSFSTVFKTSEDIVELLRTAYDAFRDVLGKMRDKVEFGLKVLWEPEIVIQEIEKEDENLRLLRQEISSQRGSTYFARMQYGRLVDSLLQQRSEQLVSDIFNALGSVSVASRVNKPIGEKMILNAAFLVSRDRESDFDSKVKEIDAKYENLKFKYTGPWPPYNFVNIRLKLERAAEAE
ncbi:MAG TPA: GvpL/GvpF family gas vesicle protein [Thermoanaerobaculia bacterium]